MPFRLMAANQFMACCNAIVFFALLAASHLKAGLDQEASDRWLDIALTVSIFSLPCLLLLGALYAHCKVDADLRYAREARTVPTLRCAAPRPRGPRGTTMTHTVYPH